MAAEEEGVPPQSSSTETCEVSASSSSAASFRDRLRQIALATDRRSSRRPRHVHTNRPPDMDQAQLRPARTAGSPADDVAGQAPRGNSGGSEEDRAAAQARTPRGLQGQGQAGRATMRGVQKEIESERAAVRASFMQAVSKFRETVAATGGWDQGDF